MSREIETKVRKFIDKYNLIQSGDHLIAGVSGGADSMMLLHFLYTHQQEYAIQIIVAHVHHGIRQEAEEDARFVEEMAKKWELPYYRHNCHVKELAKLKGISEEEAGRIERYNFFISLSNPYSKIVTAHTMNDQAETLLMRFFRGTDLRGLGGIAPQRDNIIRPLLSLQRKEIEAYCSYYGVAYQNDHTNFMPIYTRNKIRLECIPYIEKNMNPNIVQLLGEHSALYRESERFLKTHTEELLGLCATRAGDQIAIDIDKFRSYDVYIQKRIILRAIETLYKFSKNITLKHLENTVELINLQSGKKVCLPYNVIVYKEYNKLIIGYDLYKNEGYRHFIDLGEKQIPEGKMTVRLTLLQGETINQKDEKMYTKYIDYGKIKDRLQIRTRLPQDYIGTKEGTKKLKKLFIDDKIPKSQRDLMPLIADGEEIIWIIGSRLSVSYYVTESTKEVLEIQILFNDLQEGPC